MVHDTQCILGSFSCQILLLFSLNCIGSSYHNIITYKYTKVLTDYEITVESFKWPRPYIVPIRYEESILAFSLI